MSVCPGCGRCRVCGQRTAPLYPWYGPYAPQVPIYPLTVPMPNTTPYYYVGDPVPGTSGYLQVTC